MGEIVDLTKIINERVGPDEDCMTRDRLTMRRQYEYSFEYKHGGRVYSMNIWAYDIRDAKKRFNSLKATGEYSGQVVQKGDCAW